MTRDDVVRELKAYRVHLAAEMRKTDAALKAFGVSIEDAGAVRTSRGVLVPAGEKRQAAGSENGTYELLRRIGRDLPDGESLDARQAIEMLEVFGWQTDAQNKLNSVNTAMYRLAGWGEWEKVGRGRYRPRRDKSEGMSTDEAAAVVATAPVVELVNGAPSDDRLNSIFGLTDAAQA